jgi:hypothetical protein
MPAGRGSAQEADADPGQLPPPDMQQLLACAAEISEAMRYLHTCGMMHGATGCRSRGPIGESHVVAGRLITRATDTNAVDVRLCGILHVPPVHRHMLVTSCAAL